MKLSKTALSEQNTKMVHPKEIEQHTRNSEFTTTPKHHWSNPLSYSLGFIYLSHITLLIWENFLAWVFRQLKIAFLIVPDNLVAPQL